MDIKDLKVRDQFNFMVGPQIPSEVVACRHLNGQTALILKRVNELHVFIADDRVQVTEFTPKTKVEHLEVGDKFMFKDSHVAREVVALFEFRDVTKRMIWCSALNQLEIGVDNTPVDLMIQ